MPLVFMPKVSSEPPFPREQKTAFSGPEKKPICRGVASSEAGNKLADAPVPGQWQKMLPRAKRLHIFYNRLGE